MLQEKTIILFINIGQVILQTPFNLIMFNTLFGCKYKNFFVTLQHMSCLLYTSPSPRDCS